MKQVVNIVAVAGGTTSYTEWYDRFSVEEFPSKIQVFAHSNVALKITVQESDFVEATPTQNVLVNEASITAYTLYASAELTLTKRYYQIKIENVEEAVALVNAIIDITA